MGQLAEFDLLPALRCKLLRPSGAECTAVGRGFLIASVVGNVVIANGHELRARGPKPLLGGAFHLAAPLAPAQAVGSHQPQAGDFLVMRLTDGRTKHFRVLCVHEPGLAAARGALEASELVAEPMPEADAIDADAKGELIDAREEAHDARH